jgi:hypothetical protein
MVSCYKKKAANESEIRFDPRIPDIGDFTITHAIVSLNIFWSVNNLIFEK